MTRRGSARDSGQKNEYDEIKNVLHCLAGAVGSLSGNIKRVGSMVDGVEGKVDEIGKLLERPTKGSRLLKMR